jgi:hypothetical protein
MFIFQKKEIEMCEKKYDFDKINMIKLYFDKFSIEHGDQDIRYLLRVLFTFQIRCGKNFVPMHAIIKTLSDKYGNEKIFYDEYDVTYALSLAYISGWLLRSIEECQHIYDQKPAKIYADFLKMNNVHVENVDDACDELTFIDTVKVFSNNPSIIAIQEQLRESEANVCELTSKLAELYMRNDSLSNQVKDSQSE